jgi:hypothetical protein
MQYCLNFFSHIFYESQEQIYNINEIHPSHSSKIKQTQSSLQLGFLALVRSILEPSPTCVYIHFKELGADHQA